MGENFSTSDEEERLDGDIFQRSLKGRRGLFIYFLFIKKRKKKSWNTLPVYGAGERYTPLDVYSAATGDETFSIEKRPWTDHFSCEREGCHR